MSLRDLSPASFQGSFVMLIVVPGFATPGYRLDPLWGWDREEEILNSRN